MIRAINWMGAYLMMSLTASAFLLPVILSSNTFLDTEKGTSSVSHSRRLLSHHSSDEDDGGILSKLLPRRRRRGHGSTATPAAPANTAPWAGKDPIADQLWPPGCHLWSLDAERMQIFSDGGVSKKFLRSLGGTDRFPDGYVRTSSPFDGLQLGYAGLSLQKGYVLDVWIKGVFREPRMYVLAQGNLHSRPDQNGATWSPLWYLAVNGVSKAFVLHTFMQSHTINSGLNVRALSPHEWHRLTIVSLPHQGRRSSSSLQMRVFINGTERGKPVTVPAVQTLHIMGNGGGNDDFMQRPWEGMYNARVCTVMGVAEQMALEEAIHNNALQLLASTMKWESAWASQLRGRKVILVGNSAKILTGTPHGSFIDTHDVVFRFNALQSAKGHEVYLGKKTTYAVLGDLTQLCKCHEGLCCNSNHAQALMRSLGNAPGVTVMWARKDPVPESFKKGCLKTKHTRFVSIHPQKHFEEAFNEYLDSLAVAHPNITHRFPPRVPFRTGFRIIAALLFNQVEFGMIGFDLNEEKNALYNGKLTSGAEGHYVAETRVLYDLMNAGLFKSY